MSALVSFSRRLAGAGALVVLLSAQAFAQQGWLERGTELLRQARLADAEAVFAEWVRAEPDNAGALFDIAAAYLVHGDARTAVTWAARGLRRSPADAYGLDVMGSALFMSDRKIEALRFWNRAGRPQLTELRVSASGGASRQMVANTIDLAPGDLLSWREVEKAQWTLDQYRFFREVRFDPIPGDTPDQYALDVTARARSGFGSAAEVALGLFGDVSFRTIRLNYWDVAGSGVSVVARWRWAGLAERATVDVNIPQPAHLPLFLGVSYAHRHEWWTPAGGGTGFTLRVHDAAVRWTVPLRLPEFSVDVLMGGRVRELTTPPPPVPAGATAPPVSNLALNTEVHNVAWTRVAPRVAVLVNHVVRDWDFRADVKGGIQTNWLREGDVSTTWKSWISSEAHLERETAPARRQRLSAALRVGWLSEAALAEDYFVLGTGPDADFPLRAHPYLRAGTPGTAPLAGSFALANLEAATGIATWKRLAFGVVGFVDVARVDRSLLGLATSGTLVDWGVGLQLSPAVSRAQNFTIAWGRDTRLNRNVFYVTTTIR